MNEKSLVEGPQKDCGAIERTTLDLEKLASKIQELLTSTIGRRDLLCGPQVREEPAKTEEILVGIVPRGAAAVRVCYGLVLELQYEIDAIVGG